MRIESIVEALIFAADSPMKPAQFLEVLTKENFSEVDLNSEILGEILLSLTEKYNSEDFPFELRQIDGGYQFFTKREYYPYVRHAAVISSKKKLSRATLETLSIIAYRQPVTKPEVEYIRGVNCDHAVQKLLEKKLIEIKGRADAPGKPLVYATSPFFMEYFGLNNLGDLPKLQEFSIDEEEYRKQFETYITEKDPNAFDENETNGDSKNGTKGESVETPDGSIQIQISDTTNIGEEEAGENPEEIEGK